MLEYMSLSKPSTSSSRGTGYYSNARKMVFNVCNFFKKYE
jgi:hypothetical protein